MYRNCTISKITRGKPPNTFFCFALQFKLQWLYFIFLIWQIIILSRAYINGQRTKLKEEANLHPSISHLMKYIFFSDIRECKVIHSLLLEDAVQWTALFLQITSLDISNSEYFYLKSGVNDCCTHFQSFSSDRE